MKDKNKKVKPDEAMPSPLDAVVLWVWLSPNHILHREHPTRNSTTACGADWNGFNYHSQGWDTSTFRKCKRCDR